MTRHLIRCLPVAAATGIFLLASCQTAKPVASSTAAAGPAKTPDQPAIENPAPIASNSGLKFVGPNELNRLPTSQQMQATSPVESPSATVHVVPPADPKPQP